MSHPRRLSLMPHPARPLASGHRGRRWPVGKSLAFIFGASLAMWALAGTIVLVM